MGMCMGMCADMPDGMVCMNMGLDICMGTCFDVWIDMCMDACVWTHVSACM